MTQWERGRIIVDIYPRDLTDCGFAFDRGEATAAVRFQADPQGPHERATPIDRAMIHEHLLSVCHRRPAAAG
jgi:hypothetical protein